MGKTSSAGLSRNRIFLLSPANPAGVRARILLGSPPRTKLGHSLREGGVPLGDVYSFISSLYFRGKLTYSRLYSRPPAGVNGIFVITASGGLVSPDEIFTLEELRKIAAGDVHEKNSAYRVPLERDALLLTDQMGANCDVVLLGSIATQKYVEPLLAIFRERLMFPAKFLGRGDMSRGGLLLRCARENVELEYVPVAGAVNTETRPAKRRKNPSPRKKRR